jgi:hypothetical protein
MQPDRVLDYVRLTPFKPFRIVLNSGRTYDIRHPDFIDVGEDSAIFFHRQAPGTHAHYKRETFSLLLIDHIEDLEAAAKRRRRR